MRRLHKVGFELEGCWREAFWDDMIIHDASVANVVDPKTDREFRHVGEIASKPFPVESRATWERWMLEHLPDAVNATCGFHIHVSTKRRLDYARLTDKGFFRYFHRKMEEWGKSEALPEEHPFWQRLAGRWITTTPAGNRRNFTRKVFMPDIQIANRVKGNDGTCRHAQLNFCYRMHGTLECRLFPAFDKPELYLSAAHAFLNCVGSWLAKVATRKEEGFLIRINEALRTMKEAG